MINRKDFDCSFDILSKEWLIITAPQLKASSVAKYVNILDLYLLPEFGNRQITDISRGDVLSMSRKLLVSGGKKAAGLSPKTVKSIISLMKNILGYASREKGIPTADVADIFIKHQQKPMRILSMPEQHRLTDYLYNNVVPRNLGILISLYSGLRIGEVCALKWGDICIEEKYLYVHQTMQRIQITGNPNKKTQIIVQAPKSDCSVRKIPLPLELLELLETEKKDDDAYLLSGKTYRFIEPRNMENYFKCVAEQCSVYDVSFHVLRHTFATRCVELGFDIKSLSEILGHASVNITLNRYVHPSMELKQKNMNMLSELLLYNR